MIIQMVKLVDGGGYIVNSILAVPDDPLSAGWREVQDWIAAGNTPLPADPPPPPTEGQLATGGVKQWLIDNPAVMQIVNMSPAEIEVDVTTLVNALFPTASAGNKTKTIKLFTLWTLHARMTIKERL